jgi:chemotaxis signal transduction protein
MSGIPDLPRPPAAPAPAASPGPARPPAAPRLALFRLGTRLCGVAAAFCKQFVHLDAVTPVPLAPAYLLGVTQLRGHILPVFDASQLPGLSGLAAAEAPGKPEPPGASNAPSARPALVVTATGLDSALAALEVTEIVGFERPSFAAPAAPPPGDARGAVPGDAGSAVADHPATGIPADAAIAGARPLWRGEEVAVLDVAAILARLRPGAPPHLAARAVQPR